jgi:hypothetical protein
MYTQEFSTNKIDWLVRDWSELTTKQQIQHLKYLKTNEKAGLLTYKFISKVEFNQLINE